MSESDWSLVFIVAATAFAAYSLVESRGRGILNWAVLLLAVALFLGRL